MKQIKNTKKITISLLSHIHLDMVVTAKNQGSTLSKMIVERWYNTDGDFKNDLIKKLFQGLDKECRINLLINSGVETSNLLREIDCLSEDEKDLLKLKSELNTIQYLSTKKRNDATYLKKEQEIRKKIYSFYTK
jgi:hypothetical protein